MSTVVAWLERSRDSLVEELVLRLSAPAGSVYRAAGEDAARRSATALVAALLSDVAGPRDVGFGAEGALVATRSPIVKLEIRAAVEALVQELLPAGLGFFDLRLLATSLRALLFAELPGAAEIEAADRARLEAWTYELLLCATKSFVAHRERVLEERAAELEVHRLAQRLSELEDTLQEKTRLLDLLRETSTPIAPVHDGILVVPLVGVLDPLRAQALTEKLLSAIVDSQAQVVILDISGVPLFDAATAQHILKAARAAGLLGAELLLVGLSPSIAQTVVGLDVDLATLATRGTLRDGLSYALARRRLRIVPIDRR